MKEISKHCIALRDPKGKRLQLMPGQPLPDWVTDETRAQLRTMGALEPYRVASAEEVVEDPEAGAEALRAAAEAVTAPGGSVEETLGAEAAPAPGATPEPAGVAAQTAPRRTPKAAARGPQS